MPINSPHCIVRFEYDRRDGRTQGLCGKTLFFPFVSTLYSFIPFDLEVPELPEDGSLWVCKALKQNVNKGENRGFHLVQPVERLDTETAERFERLHATGGLLDQESEVIGLTATTLRKLVCSPDLLEPLEEAIAQKHTILLPANRDWQQSNIELRSADYDAEVVSAPEIGLDEMTTFAHMRGYAHPVRVIECETDPTNIVVARLTAQSIAMRQGRRLSVHRPEPAWFVQWFRLGELGWSEPTVKQPWRQRVEAVNFWLKHAHVYWPDEYDMSRPFKTSWREVLLSLDERDLPNILEEWTRA